jgi:GcrA cell cycle regulator
MQSTDWPREHSDALREYLAKRMSYSEIAEAINARFKTAYSRSATIGRARRMGLAGPEQRQDLPRPSPTPAPEVGQTQLGKPR